jgi:hypothetical protein
MLLPRLMRDIAAAALQRYGADAAAISRLSACRSALPRYFIFITDAGALLSAERAIVDAITPPAMIICLRAAVTPFSH